VFAKHQFDVGTVKEHEAHITLSEECYVAKKPYRCSIDDQREIERQVDKLLKHGILRSHAHPSQLPLHWLTKRQGKGAEREKSNVL